MSTERVHHPYSPSTLGYLEACPAYQGQQSATPHERTTAGTRAHDVVESGIDDARLSDEDALAAAECLDLIHRRRQLMEEARAREVVKKTAELWGKPVPEGKPADAAQWAEQEVPAIMEMKEVYLLVDDKQFDDGVLATTAGYVDRVLIDHTRTCAELLDWKFGKWAVEKAEDNPQGIAYTLGLFHTYPDLQKVRVFFKQPHLDMITEAVFTRAQVPALYLRIQTIVARAREARRLGDFSTANPMAPACNFCSQLGKCPKVAAFACKVGSKFHPLEIPSDITPTMVLSGPDTTLAMRLSQVMAVWAKSFRAQVTDRVLRGDAPCPSGFAVAQSSSGREVINADEFRRVALTVLTEKEYSSIAPVPGFGAIEDLVKEKAPRGSKKAAIEDFQKHLLDTGAVKPGESYTFLRAVSEKK